MNHGSIANLPERCCVEVPCLADADAERRIHPTYVAALSAEYEALNMSKIAVTEAGGAIGGPGGCLSRLRI